MIHFNWFCVEVELWIHFYSSAGGHEVLLMPIVKEDISTPTSIPVAKNFLILFFSQVLFGHIYVGSFLSSPFCSIGQYFCSCYKTALPLSLWLCHIVWGQIFRYLHLCFFCLALLFVSVCYYVRMQISVHFLVFWRLLLVFLWDLLQNQQIALIIVIFTIFCQSRAWKLFLCCLNYFFNVLLHFLGYICSNVLPFACLLL